MGRRTEFDEQLGQRCQHVFVAELACDDQRQALAAGFVDDGKDAELSPVVGAFLDEVIGPAVPRILRPQPDARAVVQPSPPAFWLALGHLKSLSQPPPPIDRASRWDRE